MKAFEVYLNGKHVATAGIETIFSLILNPNPWGNSFRCSIGGIDDATDEYIRWTVPEPVVGDVMTIKFIETDRVDPPDEREAREKPGAEVAPPDRRSDPGPSVN